MTEEEADRWVDEQMDAILNDPAVLAEEAAEGGEVPADQGVPSWYGPDYHPTPEAIAAFAEPPPGERKKP
ncbi:MAG TPA: hypothetical protein VMB72_02195 [Acidimicrobiales bacterium]|nr:hypothetical protein [Acidimicrobiales bacterium]